MENPYSILGIPPGADEQTVRRAYKRLAVANHPDRNHDPQAAERFKEIAAAYSVLTNERERRRYVRQCRREYAEQEQRRRQQAAASRRQREAAQSRAAAAAEEAFREYARTVRERQAQRQPTTPRQAATAASTRDGWFQRLSAVAALVLMAVYVCRSAMGLPLQPWLSAGAFATHALHSPIWITLSLALLMIVKPRWFLIPLFIDGVRDVCLAGWAMFLMFPFISAGGPFLPYRLFG